LVAKKNNKKKITYLYIYYNMLPVFLFSNQNNSRERERERERGPGGIGQWGMAARRSSEGWRRKTTSLSPFERIP
jgi:hypothetical protein